jgi:hypothetical protein
VQEAGARIGSTAQQKLPADKIYLPSEISQKRVFKSFFTADARPVTVEATRRGRSTPRVAVAAQFSNAVPPYHVAQHAGLALRSMKASSRHAVKNEC